MNATLTPSLALAALLLLLLPSPALAQPIASDSCKLRIGTNLSGPSDWGSEWPFVNIMKYGRTWITHNTVWVSGGQNPWDTGLLDHIQFDANGYPLSLPADVPGAEAPQAVRAIWANTRALPLGRYVLLYDGEGDLSVWGDAALASSAPGRLEFELSHQSNIFTISILRSVEGDHVRNMRVLMPGTEATYETAPFSAAWLEKLAPFKVLRFMDWGRTNNSAMRHWHQRTQHSDYTWTEKSGVPYEQWIALCNLKKADAWVCVPHAADEDYIRQLAQLFRDELHPDGKIYVEWSNETWNWIFSQAQYGLDSLGQSLPWPERMGPRIARVMELWTEVFAGQEHRLVRVLASQHAWWDLGERTFAQIQAMGQAHLIDAISPAAYMGLDNDVLSSWSAGTTGQQVLDHARAFTFNPANYAMRGWQAYAALARDNGKKLLFYEGGQHFTPHPFGSEQPYCPALLSCQTLPGMYNLYQELFDTLRRLSNEEMLFMNFSFISPPNCRYGSWGALESQFFQHEPFEDAPKYLALLEAAGRYWACQEGSAVSTLEIPAAKPAVLLYPNPAREAIWLETSARPARVSIYDAAGRLVLERAQVGHAEAFRLPVAALPRGVYTVVLWSGGEGRQAAQFVKQ